VAESGDAEQDDGGYDEAVGHACDAVAELDSKLDPVMIEPAAGDDGEAIEMRDVIGGKEPSAKVTDQASDGVYGLSENISMRGMSVRKKKL